MKLVRLLLFLGCLEILAASVHAAGGGGTKARLVLSAESARPGDTVMAGIELSMPPRWHTYWRNGGDSGTPTKIDWQLPPGISAGEVLWPPPEKYVAADLTTYVFHNQVMLLAPLTLASDIPPGSVSIKAVVSWLECDELCIQGKADVQAAISIGAESKPAQDASLIASWQKMLPTTTNAIAAKARWEKSAMGDSRSLIIEWEAPTKSDLADFFPYGGEDFEVGGATERLNSTDHLVAIRKNVKKFGDKWPDRLSGLILMASSASAPRQTVEVSLALGSEVTASAPSSVSASGETPASKEKSLAKMLLLAFLGGLILNIMPCVLPVIALKILGFVNQSKEDPKRVRQLGLIYGAGILVSFLVLAGIVIAVQQAGRAASWGMQFQNPQFVVGMTVLVTLVALNLFGLFEVTLAGGAMDAASTLAYKEGGAGAFFNGVLATALATPCTAPFLGVALGFAFAQPPAVIGLMFVMVGLGLAAPYVVLSWEPGWLKFLPKPGAWMEKFKIAMGFPMLATAIWLLWLTTSHFGRDGILWIGIFLATLAMAAWIWGEFVQRNGKRRGMAMATSVVLVAGSYYYALEKELHWRSPSPTAKAGKTVLGHAGGIPWQPWTAKAVAAARSAGHPVMVDFTADWCVTCQVNKKTSLEISSVQAKLKDIDAVSFLGDYTNSDPAIAEELKRYERAGVPLVLIYPADPNAPPEVLPEVLTPDIVLKALNKVAGSKTVSTAQTRQVQPENRN